VKVETFVYNLKFNSLAIFITKAPKIYHQLKKKARVIYVRIKV